MTVQDDEVKHLRAVAEAARALLASRTWANSSLVTSGAAPIRRLEVAIHALALHTLNSANAPAPSPAPSSATGEVS